MTGRWFCAAVFLGLVISASAPAQPRLPPKSAFPAAMPRYPNLWFYVERSRARDYHAAVGMVTGELRRKMGLVENRGPMSNPEGCDFEAGIEHLQPWQGSDPALQHAHAFHIRYYYKSLAAKKLEETEVDGVRYYRLAASAHYEVEHFNPNHADVESCPICGRTGAYASEHGNLVERVHDPLGLELVTTGKIRGEPVRHYTGEPVRPVTGAVHTFAPAEAWMNTQRVAVITFRKR